MDDIVRNINYILEAKKTCTVNFSNGGLFFVNQHLSGKHAISMQIWSIGNQKLNIIKTISLTDS